MGTYTGTPRTWTAGETVTAALMNSDVRDPFTALSAAWTSYTPTLGVFTLGNGTITGRYVQFGKLVMGTVELTFGSTTTAATGLPTLTLPVTGVSAVCGSAGYFYDLSAGAQYITTTALNTTQIALGVVGTNGLRGNCSTTAPFTWATGDLIRATFAYEAA